MNTCDKHEVMFFTACSQCELEEYNTFKHTIIARFFVTENVKERELLDQLINMHYYEEVTK